MKPKTTSGTTPSKPLSEMNIRDLDPEPYNFYDLMKDVERAEKNYSEIGRTLLETYPVKDSQYDFDKFLEDFKL